MSCIGTYVRECVKNRDEVRYIYHSCLRNIRAYRRSGVGSLTITGAFLSKANWAIPTAQPI